MPKQAPSGGYTGPYGDDMDNPYQKELDAIARKRKPQYPRSGIVHIRYPGEGHRSLCGLYHDTDRLVRFRRKGREPTCKTCCKKAGIPKLSTQPKPKAPQTVWERLQADD